MWRTDENALTERTYFLERGYVYFCKEPVKILAVLGPAVAICLWDRKTKYGAMNHYLKPTVKNKSTATPMYGNAATVALIRMMLNAGCKKRDIVAQIFGGSKDEGGSDNSLGEENVQVARSVLSRKGIKVVSEDVGGTLGRKVIFDIASGQAAVIKVDKIRSTDWTH